MLALRDNLRLSVAALAAHKLRAALTVLGLTMGVATLITVMTLIQGANTYVEQKVARLGTEVFQFSRTPFTVTDFDAAIRALRHKRFYMPDKEVLARACRTCDAVGASASSTARIRYGNASAADVSLSGLTASMVSIDSRTVADGRYFTELEDQHGAAVCLIGDQVFQHLFGGAGALGRVLHIANLEFTVIGVMDRIGSVLGQDQDSFVIVPMSAFERLRGTRGGVIISVKAAALDRALDEARLIIRDRRHIRGGMPEDFFVGTKDSYIDLWKSISSAFFAVFLLVSSISAVVGGIVIMNVMLVSVTERTKEIGVRRAVGASQSDIRRQFLAESVMQCLMGGVAGILAGFACAVTLRELTAFPADVETWVAALGVVLSTGIGLFFGIYPAIRAARLDPVVALRSE